MVEFAKCIMTKRKIITSDINFQEILKKKEENVWGFKNIYNDYNFLNKYKLMS